MTRPGSVPNPDPVPEPAPEPAPATEHAAEATGLPASRRAFIAGAGAVTVAGAAAVAVGTAAGTAGIAAAAHHVTTADGDAPAGGNGPAVVAYVRDLASGELRLMSGEREVVVRDRALARTLARHLDTQEG